MTSPRPAFWPPRASATHPRSLTLKTDLVRARGQHHGRIGIERRGQEGQELRCLDHWRVNAACTKRIAQWNTSEQRGAHTAQHDPFTSAQDLSTADECIASGANLMLSHSADRIRFCKDIFE